MTASSKGNQSQLSTSPKAKVEKVITAVIRKMMMIMMMLMLMSSRWQHHHQGPAKTAHQS